MLLVGWIKCINGLADIIHDSGVAILSCILGPVVCVPACIEGCSNIIISEEHVLRVIVDEVALLVA